MSLPKSESQKLFENHPNKSLIKPNPTPKNAVRKPQGLSKEAEKLWRKLVPQLQELQLATAIDEASLIGMCEWWAVYVNAQESLKLIENYASIEATRALNASKISWSEFRRMAESFGLTPQARTGIHVEKPHNDDDELNSLKQ